MLRLGLTGGVGTGKSTVAGLMIARGLPVVDTDELARQFTRPGQPVLDRIVAHFGPPMLNADGTLKRAALAERVFADAGAREQLEAILHPPIREAWRRQLEDWRVSGCTAGVVVIPLLYETGAAGEFDAVICTACTAVTQRERLRQRGWNDAQIDARLAAQMALKAKMQRADVVIWTEGAMGATGGQLGEVLDRLLPAAV